MHGVRLGILGVVLTLSCSVIAPAEASVKKCPAHTGTDFYANPRVKRPKGLKPTGVASPKVCTFPTITKALSKIAATGVAGRVIATGASSSEPAVFSRERFPIFLTTGVDIITADDPTLGGGGFDPTRYVIKYQSNDSPQAISILGNSEFRGFTVKNTRRADGSTMVGCSDGEADIEDVALDGASKNGGDLQRGLTTSGDCSLLAAGLSATAFAGDGITIHGGSTATLTDSRSVSNGGNGIFVLGNLTATGIEVASNGADGINVLTNGEDVHLHNFDIHDNASAGLRIDRTGPGQVQTSGDRPTLRSLSKIRDNGGHGIAFGSSLGNIDAVIGATDIFGNERGIDIADQGTTNSTVIQLLDNDVFTNRSHGALIGPSTISFAQNKFHNNALNQVVFDGGGTGYAFAMNSPTDMCDAGANAVYCYTSEHGFGIFAQGTANVTIEHTQFEGGGTGLKDFSAQSGSTISVSQNCTAITVCP